jgi:hypothetical protein
MKSRKSRDKTKLAVIDTDGKFHKPSKADIKKGMERLRYMDIKAVEADFKKPEERAAIAAVFKWLSLNALCAWQMKDHCHYSVIGSSKSIKRDWAKPYDALVLDEKRYEAARKLFPTD